jgi:hypothetical protein
MSTKLEELKALMRGLEKPTPKNATSEEVNRLCRDYDITYFKRNALLDKLLPQLIAVAEAAKKVCWYDFSTCDLDGDVILDMRHLETADRKSVV